MERALYSLDIWFRANGLKVNPRPAGGGADSAPPLEYSR